MEWGRPGPVSGGIGREGDMFAFPGVIYFAKNC